MKIFGSKTKRTTKRLAALFFALMVAFTSVVPVIAADPTSLEITFPTGEDGVADIDHTFVDESLRGQGVASQLVRAAAAELRAQGKRAKSSCWYAAQWFEKHPQEQDLLYKD